MSSAEIREGAAASAVERLEHAATLEGWRERGRHRFDPVRFRFIEALTRRAAACGGAARSLLEDRIAVLLAAYGRDLEESRWDAAQPGGSRAASPRPSAARSPAGRHATQGGGSAAAVAAGQDDRPRRGALSELVEHLARHARSRADGPATGALAGRPGLPPALGTLGSARSTWARLSAERRVAQSLAKPPGNAGPLNSQRLVHQTLMQMRALSPDYLRHFTAHVDALLWLEELQGVRGGAAARSAPSAVR